MKTNTSLVLDTLFRFVLLVGYAFVMVQIGGFHLSKLPLDETLASYVDQLNAYQTVYYTCHCTGVEQFRFMQGRMEHLRYISAGDSVVI